MRKPSNDKLMLAAEWLLAYDSEAEEASDMVEVAKWLQFTVLAGEARSALRAAGIPPSASNVRKLQRAGEG